MRPNVVGPSNSLNIAMRSSIYGPAMTLTVAGSPEWALSAKAELESELLRAVPWWVVASDETGRSIGWSNLASGSSRF